jgi:hypothetical protein
MSQETLEMQGTVQPDGSLVLDEKVQLPAGRVTVVLRQEGEPKPPRSLGFAFFQMMAEIRADQRARGHFPRGMEETAAERRTLRQEMDDEIEAAIRLQEETRRHREQAGSETNTP